MHKKKKHNFHYVHQKTASELKTYVAENVILYEYTAYCITVRYF